MIGQTISHYSITGRLGAGGMGEVYLANDTKLDRQVAVKFLPAAVWNEAEAQQRLIREAKSASKLDHPNIVTIYGIEEFEGRPFIIMAHVPGATLKEYCTAKERTIDELIAIAVQVADGLQHAHENGVIHRDLKPGNILVDERGRARILDFGIASLRGAAKLTQTGTTLGTLAYAAPELAMGKEAAPSADIYSLGVVLYQMLTGQLPFDADHEAALLYSILHEAPKPLSDFDASIPSEVQSIVMRCLEKQPEKRFADCGELIAKLKAYHQQTAAGANGVATKDKPSIAVLPFANMSADPDNEYFSDGLTEELLNVLAKNPGLKVTGRTSCFAFKGKSEDLRDIGQKLGVETLLEGSVRKAGNRVRITTQLVKASDGFHLWSETYDRVLDDIFAVQDDIAKSVSEAMHVTLLGQPETETKAKVNPESYSLILRANHLAVRLSENDLAKAVELYNRALEIDSNDARAWAGLALVLGTQAGYGFAVDIETVMTEGVEAAERALSLDNQLPEAHITMGWFCLAYLYDFPRAGSSFRQAVALAPGHGRGIGGLATYEAFCGSMEEALRLAKQSVELDPLSAISHLFCGRVQFLSGNYDEAYRSFSNALELSSDMTSLYSNLASVRLMQGRYEEALRECEKEQSEGYRSHKLGMIYHAMGDRQKSDEQLAILCGLGEQWAVQIADIYAYREELDPAFEWLERAYAVHDPGIPAVRVAPFTKNLHGDPRWTAFVKKVGWEVPS